MDLLPSVIVVRTMATLLYSNWRNSSNVMSEGIGETEHPPLSMAAVRSEALRLHLRSQHKLSNESTCLLLKHQLEKYSQLFSDDSKPESVNSFSKPIKCLLEGKVQTNHCSSWKSSLRSSNIDIMELIKENLTTSGHCNIKNNLPCASGNITSDELKLFLNKNNPTSSDSKLESYPSTSTNLVDNRNVSRNNTDNNIHLGQNKLSTIIKKESTNLNKYDNKIETPTYTATISSKQDNVIPLKKQNPPKILQKINFFHKQNNSNESKVNTNDAKSNDPGGNTFKTARTELLIQNKKKYGNPYHNIPQENNTSAPKRSLGTTRSVQNKFIPPMISSNEDVEEQMPEDEILQDERLKHIDPKMVELIMSEIIDSSAPIGWEDIAGLEFAKTAIQEAVVWPLLRPDIFTGLRRPPRGILLFGPPGTGKTLIGKCIASQCSATFFSISASSLTSKWLGDGEKMVRALFAVARCHQPAVVFIDEIDSLLTQRSESEHEATRRIKTEFLVQLDGAAIGDEDRMLLIGATNRPQELDEAARRRLVKRLYIPLPDMEARKQIITRLMSTESNSLTEYDITNVAELADGFSGADMRSLCSEAALGPIRSVPLSQITNIRSDQVRPVDIDDFKKALTRVRPSVSSKDLEHYIKWNQTYGSDGKHF